jgi:hypothetical protein
MYTHATGAFTQNIDAVNQKLLGTNTMGWGAIGGVGKLASGVSSAKAVAEPPSARLRAGRTPNEA